MDQGASSQCENAIITSAFDATTTPELSAHPAAVVLQHPHGDPAAFHPTLRDFLQDLNLGKFLFVIQDHLGLCIARINSWFSGVCWTCCCSICCFHGYCSLCCMIHLCVAILACFSWPCSLLLRRVCPLVRLIQLAPAPSAPNVLWRSLVMRVLLGACTRSTSGARC